MSAAQMALPEGWVEGFDPTYGRPYYFHKLTRRSSWTRPTAAQNDAGFDHGREESSFSFRSTGGGNESPIQLSSSFRRSQFSNSFQSAGGSPGQRPVSRFNEWLEVFSPEHNRTFFFNKVTRESTWVDPREHIRYDGGGSRATMVQTEETPAAFLSIWESVGTSSFKQASQDKSMNSTLSPQKRSAPSEPVASPARAAVSSNPPVFVASSSQQPVMMAQAQPSQTSVFSSSPQKVPPTDASKGPDLADELEMFARDLERHQGILQKKTATMGDASTVAEADALASEMNELTRTAEAMLASTTTKSSSRIGMKRLLSEDSQLSIWGNEPVKVLDVKRAMQDVKTGAKYVREELKAQKEANDEAKVVDAEGGYYTILGVPTDADLDTMKKAYRRAMIKCHPDKVPASERNKAMEKANQLQNAFNCLSDPWERYLYDYFGLNRYLQNSKVIQCFKNYLLSGVEIIKHPRKGYPRRRFLWISPDYEWIMTGPKRILEPTPEEREQMKGVRIKDIHEISRGICTEVLSRTGKPKKQSQYFSFITAERSLDIEAESKERADFLVSRISLLVLDVQKNKKWLHRHFELKALKDAAVAAQKAQRGYTPKPPDTPPPDNNDSK